MSGELTVRRYRPGDLLDELLEDVDGATTRLERFNVLPTHQRKGYGTQLYEE